LIRFLIPAGAVGFAAEAEARRSGLFNNPGLPLYHTIPAAFVLFDFAIYLQLVMFHAVPLLWRVHRMHHADLDFDVTTGVRFHPIEILLSLGVKLGLVAAPPAVAVLIFEAALNSTSMFNHSNLRIPDRIDAVLRNLLVTPDMHRVHHSIVVQETNSNFGFNLSWWDRILGTYCPQPAAGHEQMIIGIDIFRDPAELRLDRMLWQPFKSGVGNYPINRRAA
jgi:sterol desaturase/sphingolipid hydroxylase (fatty acid hydroxylase superfamily)